MSAFIRTELRMTIQIQRLITLYYFEFAHNYVFEGERHNFWEIVYVDKGEVVVTSEDKQTRLESGCLIFHKPKEFHSFYASEGTAPNIIVITFDCMSKAMRRFEHRMLQLTNDERNLLSGVLKEGKQAFVFPFAYPLQRRRGAAEGSEQLIRMYLELLLLNLLRRLDGQETKANLLSPAQQIQNSELVRQVVALMQRKSNEKISFDDICASMHVTRTRLKEEFKRQTGMSVMKYFMTVKIEQAKSLIRESPNNFTEIADCLGFNCVHAFSKTFKKTTGMTPTEYARSVKARV